MPRRFGAALVAMVAVLGIVGCSKAGSGAQDPKGTATTAAQQLEPITEDGLTAKLRQLGGLDASNAACTAKVLYPQLTDEEKRRLNQPNPPDAVTASVLDKAADAGAGCAP